MGNYRRYYRKGGLVSLFLRSFNDTASSLGSTIGKPAYIMAKEWEFRKDYSIPFSHRIRAWRNGFLSRGYILLQLKSKDPSLYLSDMQQSSLRPSVNKKYKDVIENKLAFYLATEPYIDTIPEVFGIVRSGKFEPLCGEYNIKQLLKNEKRLISKPLYKRGGEGVRLLEIKNGKIEINNGTYPDRELQEFLSNIENHIITEFIEQHEYAYNIWPHSTNTIRILTVEDPSTNELFVAQAVHRFGSNKTGPTDNWTGGGIVAPVDIETGELDCAVRYSTDKGLKHWDVHPNSGEQVAGIKIPQWNEIKETVLEVSNIHKQNPYVGWDVVLSNNGPVILEGNCAPGSHSLQIGSGLLEDDRVREFIKQI